MGTDFNVFRILGDVSHSTSKLILLYSIHRNKSAEGVSLLTQLLYVLVFCTRYLDLFWVPPWYSKWNTVLKICYIGSSVYVVWLMMRVYPRTREKERAWKMATWTLGSCAVLSPFVTLIFRGTKGSSIFEGLWIFSIMLEAFCVLPQLLLLRQTSVPTVIDSFYLTTLGAYRAFYLINWIWRLVRDGSFDPVSWIFGVVQTALYVDFAWVYWTRQRVKLRGGSIVDGDDLSKSFLVRRFIGNRGRPSQDDDILEEDEVLARQESGSVDPSVSRKARSWGVRGISVSADDTLYENDAKSAHGRIYADVDGQEDAQMMDPSHFEEDEGEDAAYMPPNPPAKEKTKNNKRNKNHEDLPEDEGGSSAGEWQDNVGRK